MRLEARATPSRAALLGAPFGAVAFTLLVVRAAGARGPARRWAAPIALLLEGGFGSRLRAGARR